MRARAMESPAQRPSALYSMYDQLQYAADKAGVPKEDLRKQLWNELRAIVHIHFINFIHQLPSDSDVTPSSSRRPLLAHPLKSPLQQEMRRWLGNNSRPSQWR